MNVTLRPLERGDLHDAARIWNGVIAEADSFPGDTPLSDDEAWAMFAQQTVTACAFADERMAGVYILHPNGFGRCGHIANASYAVDPAFRGRGVGRAMVTDCIARAGEHGFTGLQFNAVVVSNYPAIALYLKLGFRVVGTVRNGFCLKDGGYRDTLIFLLTWLQ